MQNRTCLRGLTPFRDRHDRHDRSSFAVANIPLPWQNSKVALEMTQSVRRGDSSTRMTGMSDVAVSTDDLRDVASDGARMDTDDDFVRAFNVMRTELVNTLFFVLGSHEDAQDVAQDVFL